MDPAGLSLENFPAPDSGGRRKIAEKEMMEMRGLKISDLALSILGASPHATFCLENRKIIFANDAVARVFGYRPGDLIGRSTRVLYATEEEYRKVGQDLYPILNNNIIKTEYSCKHKDGSIIICRLSMSRVGMTDRYVVVTYENISDLRRIEAQLLESESLYRTLAENTLAGVYVVQDGKFKYINNYATSNLGYRPAELVGQPCLNMVYPEDRPNVRKSSRKMLHGERTTPYTYRAVDRRGKVRWIMETVTNIIYEGRPAVLGNSMDITEINDAREEIERFNELRSSILDATPVAILYLEGRRIIFANDAVEDVFGWKREELIGNTTRMLFRSERDFEEMGLMAYSALKKSRVFNEKEYIYRHKDGREILCRIKAVRIGHDLQNNHSIIATYENITEQKKILEDLRIKTQGLEEANIALNVILKRREADKSAIEESMAYNIRELIIPCIQQVKKYRMDSAALGHLSLAESYLVDIVSPFLHRLYRRNLPLTHKEIVIANFLKDGKSSKEIAGLLNITTRGVEFHRYRIRSKLGINNSKQNLRSYLLALHSDAEA